MPVMIAQTFTEHDVTPQLVPIHNPVGEQPMVEQYADADFVWLQTREFEPAAGVSIPIVPAATWRFCIALGQRPRTPELSQFIRLADDRRDREAWLTEAGPAVRSRSGLRRRTDVRTSRPSASPRASTGRVGRGATAT
jgi:hypothetical protein